MKMLQIMFFPGKKLEYQPKNCNHDDLNCITAVEFSDDHRYGKAWEDRLNNSEAEGFLKSNEDDPELIVYIPFTSDVKIKGISIVGGTEGTSPSKMRAFINREGIDFSDAQNMEPVQEWELAENLQGVLEYQTRFSRFQSVGNPSLHFPTIFGGNTTKIFYIGLHGEATAAL